VLASAAQFADLATFILMVSTYGMAVEMNPLVHALGFWVAVVVKVALIAAFAFTRHARSARFPRYVAVIAGSLGAASNLLVLL
jgi:cytochrome c-type biogenesis protein CcmH/NrfF